MSLDPLCCFRGQEYFYYDEQKNIFMREVGMDQSPDIFKGEYYREISKDELYKITRALRAKSFLLGEDDEN